jgi:hypothetical protein
MKWQFGNYFIAKETKPTHMGKSVEKSRYQMQLLKKM